MLTREAIVLEVKPIPVPLSTTDLACAVSGLSHGTDRSHELTQIIFKYSLPSSTVNSLHYNGQLLNALWVNNCCLLAEWYQQYK